jgi:hypothetical protein
MSMKCALSTNFKTHLLRAELIHLIERGDSSARELLAGLTEYHGDSVQSLVGQYQKTAGSLFIERFLFCVGALCLGLSLGVCGLTVADLVPAEVESLLLCFGAFLVAQWSFSQYGKRAHARFYADGYSRVLARKN